MSGETEDQSAKISSPKNADQKWSGKVRVGPRFGFGPVRNFAKHEALGTVLGISHVTRPSSGELKKEQRFWRSRRSTSSSTILYFPSSLKARLIYVLYNDGS